MPVLFTPFTLKSATLRNRIVVSPMCQYSSVHGIANEWHRVHYASLARSGAALVIMEATAVAPDGRITPGCAGLWGDDHAEALMPIVRSMHLAGTLAGVQLAHAGRKGSANLPWEGGDHIPDGDPRGWQTISASAVAFGGVLPKVPRAMTLTDIARVKANFVAAAIRARDVGFDWLELHFAHGYLAMNFLSKHSNQRTDQYGGSFENRSRLLCETVDAVREVWPMDRPLAIRLGAMEYDGMDDENLAYCIELVKKFKQQGVDIIDVSVGASTPTAATPREMPAFLAPAAQRLRTEGGLPTTASWNLGVPELAEQAIASGQVDLVTIAKAFLANPHWPYYAARKLGADKPSWLLPAPYAYWLERYTGDT